MDSISDTMSDMIQLKELSKYFALSGGLFGSSKQQVRAVDGVNLNVGRGGIMGLVGESGSGKTTLARVVLNLVKPTLGSVVIDGIDTAKADREQEARLRAEVSVVFQDPASNLNPRQTVEGSIMRPMMLHKTPAKTARQKAREAMGLVKMDELYLRSYPHQLSGGQLQRIAIARALVLEPKVMILDEPTSALDISVQAQVLNLLLDLQEGMGLTYMIITHDLNVIRYFSERVAVMYLGRLMEVGPTSEVAVRPKHPYSQGLMAASPVLDPTKRGREKTLMGGESGSLIDLPPGCRFCPRCKFAKPRCREREPLERELEPGHSVSCFLYE